MRAWHNYNKESLSWDGITCDQHKHLVTRVVKPETLLTGVADRLIELKGKTLIMELMGQPSLWFKQIGNDINRASFK